MYGRRRSTDRGASLLPQPPSKHLEARHRSSSCLLRPSKRKFDLACSAQALAPSRDGVPRTRHLAKSSGKCHSDTINDAGEEIVAQRRQARTSLSGNIPPPVSIHAQKFSDRENWLGNESSGSVHSQTLKTSVRCENTPKGGEGKHWQAVHTDRSVWKKGLKDSTNIRPSVASKQGSRALSSDSPKSCDNLKLQEALEAEKLAFHRLQAELEEERNASSSAANEAMAMIVRLQEEKAAVLMEARQFKRMAEEREIHNQEAIALLKEMLLNKEEETLALEGELATHRYTLLGLEGSHQDFGSVQTLEDMGVCVFEDAQSMHSYVGLKAWPNSSADLEQLPSLSNDMSEKVRQRELTDSRFVSRRNGKDFKDLISGSVRSNLVTFFNQAGKPIAGSQEYTGPDSSRCMDKSRPICGNEDDVDMIGAEVNCEEFHTTLQNFNSSEVGKHFSLDSPKFATKTPQSAEITLQESRVDNPGSAKKDKADSLWERIMNLEHRLDTFGMDEQLQEHEGSVNPRAVLGVSTPECDVLNGSTQRERVLVASCFPVDSLVTIRNSSERPTKVQRLECSDDIQSPIIRHNKTLESEQLHSGSKFSHMEQYRTSENPYNEMPVDIGVHDVYEVGHMRKIQTHQGQNLDLEKPESPMGRATQELGVNIHKKQKPADFEIGEDHVSQYTGMACMSKSQNGTPQSSVMTRDTRSEEVQQLTTRLRVLEEERHFMHDAIDSLKKENEELRLLQEIALQLQELKKTVGTCKQSNKRPREEQSSFFSFLKNLSSLLPRSFSQHESSLGGSLGRNMGSNTVQSNGVGLSCLLERTPQCKTGALMLRGLKVRMPVQSSAFVASDMLLS